MDRLAKPLSLNVLTQCVGFALHSFDAEVSKTHITAESGYDITYEQMLDLQEHLNRLGYYTHLEYEGNSMVMEYKFIQI